MARFYRDPLVSRVAVGVSLTIFLTSTSVQHLALLKRWYYRGSRTGEIFFADDKGYLPMRRIVRGIGRVLKGEKPEAEVVNPTGNT